MLSKREAEALITDYGNAVDHRVGVFYHIISGDLDFDAQRIQRTRAALLAALTAAPAVEPTTEPDVDQAPLSAEDEEQMATLDILTVVADFGAQFAIRALAGAVRTSASVVEEGYDLPEGQSDRLARNLRGVAKALDDLAAQTLQ